jgi:sterol desaturase/sphingolipid hydroxylase (fatty acid hydroxylase superfamily)
MEHREFVGRRLVRDAIVTVAVIFLAVAALDDITTDSAVSFLFERTALVGCALWFAVVAWRLWRSGHRVLGGLSFALVALGALMQPAVGPGLAPTKFAYLATVGALAWFLVMAGTLAVFAWRPSHRHAS